MTFNSIILLLLLPFLDFVKNEDDDHDADEDDDHDAADDDDHDDDINRAI